MILDDKALSEIKQRAEKASLGPWINRMGEIEMGDKKSLVSGVNGDMYPEDSEFVAHAREDIPALLDTVTFWKGRAEELDKALLVIDDMLLREYSFTRIEIIRRMAVIREEIEKRTTPMVTHGDKSGGKP